MTNTALAIHSPQPDPTAQQVLASDPAVSVWVNASAGSGKTTILTKRVTRLLLAGVKPHKILCLTFTRAAAAEMSLRVMQQLSHWAVCGDNDLNKSLSELQGRHPTDTEMTDARRLFAEALACPGGMRIRTLHAFGQEILRRFPIESGLPPHFAVIEENDARDLQNEVLTDLLREASATPDSDRVRALDRLIKTLGEKAFREAVGNVLHEKAQLAKALAQHGGLDKLIGRLRAELSLAPEDTENSLLHAAFEPDVFPEAAIRAAAVILQQGSKTYCERGDMILTWLMRDRDERIASFALYRDCFLTQDGKPFTDVANKDLLRQHTDLEPVLRREAARLLSLAERCEAVATAETTAAVLVVGEALIARYHQRKRQQALLDYDDLVYETLNLLQRPGLAPWVLHKLDDGLDHLLVDEAQDTSRAQWDIVAALAEEFFAGAAAHDNNRTLFVVGDEKQSIYSFQNADPEAFAAMRSFFKAKIKSAEKRYEEIPLHVSFRSAPAVLRAVDAVFSDPNVAKGVSATAVQHLSHRHSELFGRVELWPLLPQDKAEKQNGVWDLPIGYESEHDPQAELAATLAATIKGWLRRGDILPGMDRPIRPGDIMILLRKRGRFADLMVRALKQGPDSVAVTGVDRMRLLEQLPVMDLLALIQFALLPEDDLNLATVLRGPLLKISEDELMHLAAQRHGISLWQSLKNAAIASPFREAYDYLAAWLGKADYLTPLAMLTAMLNEPCPASPISGRRALWSRLGLDAMDPVEELLNAAQNFSRRHPPSLQSFLHWLTISDSEIKREMDVGAGQVRIMTIHAAKGLEAPIVFLPDTATVPRVQEVPKFVWDKARQMPFYLATKPDSGTMRRLWDVARTQQFEEYRRLLYVALTRASHRLYIGGWEPAKKEADGDLCWHNLIKNGLQKTEPHAQNVNHDNIVWEDAYLASARKQQPTETPPPIKPLPDWAFQPAPVEKNAAPSLAPSKLAHTPSAATPDQAFARGRIIHRLLQSLPDVEAARRESAARRFLAQPQHNLDQSQQNDIVGEVMRLLQCPDFAPLFGPTSRAEVPLAGSMNGQPVSGQVDRLALLDHEVWIVDYKTNRPPPAAATAIPDMYRAQMEAYRSVLQALYPERKVRCFLLWTYGAALMEVPASPIKI